MDLVLSNHEYVRSILGYCDLHHTIKLLRLIDPSNVAMRIVLYSELLKKDPKDVVRCSMEQWESITMPQHPLKIIFDDLKKANFIVYDQNPTQHAVDRRDSYNSPYMAYKCDTLARLLSTYIGVRFMFDSWMIPTDSSTSQHINQYQFGGTIMIESEAAKKNLEVHWPMKLNAPEKKAECGTVIFRKCAIATSTVAKDDMGERYLHAREFLINLFANLPIDIYMMYSHERKYYVVLVCKNDADLTPELLRQIEMRLLKENHECPGGSFAHLNYKPADMKRPLSFEIYNHIHTQTEFHRTQTDLVDSHVLVEPYWLRNIKTSEVMGKMEFASKRPGGDHYIKNCLFA